MVCSHAKKERCCVILLVCSSSLAEDRIQLASVSQPQGFEGSVKMNGVVLLSCLLLFLSLKWWNHVP